MTPPRCTQRRAALAGTGGLLVLAAGCLAPAPRQVAVWCVDEDALLTAETPPSAENSVYSAARGQVRLAAALNETVAFQVVLRTTGPPAGPFDIRLSDLSGPGGHLPARTAAAIYRAHYVRVQHFRSWYPDHAGRPATPLLVPDVLVPWEAPRGGGPLRLSEPRNEILWIDLHVPPTLAPGAYRGRLELRHAAGGPPVFGCDVLLEVHPVALPGRRSLPAICRIDPRDLLAAHLRWPAAPAEETLLLPDQPSHLAAVRLVGQTMELFHAHRAAPILWASFPKFRPLADHAVEVNWNDYDRLVEPWLDGTAFADRARLEVWALPASLEYPDAARNGGLGTPRYARLLAAYLRECRRHFAERGWLERAIVRVCGPRPLTQDAVDALRELSAIVRQSEGALPILAHLPPRSLAGLGWQDAPGIDLPDVQIWAPPATWFEPAAMEREQKLGRRAWLMPAHPPYSGTLALEGGPTDVRVLPWQAYRYGAEALWIEDAAALADPARPPERTPWSAPGLVYAGSEFGLHDRPVPALRLKRLRRGLQDYELLRLLEDHGRRLLARSLAERIVPWAGTDACLDNLLTCKPAGWPREALPFQLARELLLRELAGLFEPDTAPTEAQTGALARWALMMADAERITAGIDGIRLTQADRGLRARVHASVTNASSRTLSGQWTLPAPPAGWQAPAPVPVTVPAGGRQTAALELDLSGLTYNTDGAYPLELVLATGALGDFAVQGRLAVAACQTVERAPQIDGRLDDWPLATSNAAGDFRLCRSAAAGPADVGPRPTLPTQAFFTRDREHLYIGVRCGLLPGEPPAWQADNAIPVDGAMPWGQDVVEILIDPRPTGEGTAGDIYCLQVKPSGLLIARRGCRTEPPVGRSEPWPTSARVAASVEREAWVVELAVPLAALGAPARRNPVWGLNVTRLDARRGEYSSWSGARATCYTPRALGNLLMLWP